MLKNLKEECLKILILGKLGLNLCFGKAFHLIIMHFIPNIQCLEEFFFSKTDLFFKNLDLTCSNHFFKTFSNSFFSLRFKQAQSSFFLGHFRPNFLQGFPLSRPVCLLYHFFFIYFQFFMHLFMH